MLPYSILGEFTKYVETKLCSNEEQFSFKMITEEQDENGWNPIMVAAEYNKDDILDYLCKTEYTQLEINFMSTK